ncbi:MAG: hypothetical protein ACM3NN_00755 [Nitrospirota bacterium]
MSYNEQVIKTSEQKQQSARGFDTYGLLAYLSISVFLITWITLASKSLNFGTVVFLFALPWALVRAGGIITAGLRFPSFFALDLLLGVTVVSVTVMTWTFFVPVSLWVLLIALLVALATIPKLLPRHRRDPLSALGLLSVIVSLVAATGWSHDLILPARHVGGTVIFKPWSDFFIHATFVARSLRAETLFQVGNYEWKGFPAIFYHYASYSIPICLAKAGSLPGYATVVGFWAPFGSFLTGLASYALGRVFWSQAAGVAALVATFLLPDLCLLNIAHPTYGYFWLQHAAPGGLYGVAVAGTALILIAEGVREGRRGWIASGVIVGALVIFFKIQIFAAAFPLLVSFAIVGWPPRRQWQWFILGGCVAAGIALLPFANRFYIGPNVRFDLSGSVWYWQVLAKLAKGTTVESWYRVFNAVHPFPLHLPQAIGLLLINSLGLFALVAPIVWLFVAWRGMWQVSEGISLGAITILLLMTFGMGGTGISDNAHEFIHRPFVWAYWLVGSLATGRLFSMLTARRPELWTRILVVSSIVLTLVPVCYGSGLQHGKGSVGNVRSNIHVDRGLIDCARYIREHPPADAIVQDSQLDKFLIVGGLSDRPSFAARVDEWTRQSRAFRESGYKEQLEKLQKLQQATNIADLQRAVRETGIRWYVAHPDDSNMWPAEFRDQPAFESNGYRVYDMERCFNLRG